MSANGAGSARWVVVVKPNEQELFSILRQRLDGSGVEVILDRRSRERRRGSAGSRVDRRVTERRRQSPVALVSVSQSSVNQAQESVAAVRISTRLREPATQSAPVTHRCPTCYESVELELPRFPHPPARVEMEVGHAKGNGRDLHYVEIAAFTVSGRLILSQRVPARRSA